MTAKSLYWCLILSVVLLFFPNVKSVSTLYSQKSEFLQGYQVIIVCEKSFA